MQLTLLEKNQESFLPLNEVKNYIRVDHDYDDNIIKIMTSATMEAMETILQKSIMKQKLSYKLNAYDLKNLIIDEKDYVYALSNSLVIRLPKSPVITIEEITINYTDGTQKKLTEYGKQVDNRLCIKIPQTYFGEKFENIEIVYYAGIAETSENVPYQLRLAGLKLVANAYQNRFKYDSADFMPNNIEKMMSPFKNMMRVL